MSLFAAFCAPAAACGTATAAPQRLALTPPSALAGARPVLLLDAAQSLSDAPAARAVDTNTAASPFAGVPSLFIGGRSLATGAVISPRHIITAAHCFDPDNVGVNAVGTDVAVFFNGEGDLSLVIPASGVQSVTLHPDFTGFGHPSVNDDLAIITLRAPLPPCVPVYPLARRDVRAGEAVELVGYGESGDGVRGYAPGTGSFTTKRLGANAADMFFADDEGRTIDGAPVVEVWAFDFDGPVGDGPSGGPTLGDGVETTLGSGDSGGPGFIVDNGRLALFSVNTFVAGPGRAGRFGSTAGGQVVAAYRSWIESVVARDLADRNRDGAVDAADLGIVLAHWGDAGGAGDVNGDGFVNMADLASLLSSWTAH